jgi:CHAD domain-containing protein
MIPGTGPLSLRAALPGEPHGGSRIEREIKFRLADGGDGGAVRAAIEAAGFVLAPEPPLTHEDRYLDTDDWLLYRAGVALRLRAEGARVMLEAKSVRSASEEALERTEWAQAAPPGDPPWPAGLPEGPVAALLQPLGSLRALERLRVVARIRNVRKTWRWLRGDETLGSVTVDQVEIGPAGDAAGNGRPGAPASSYREIEIETLNGADEALGEVRRAIEGRLGLSASGETKLEAALLASGARLPERDERAFLLHPGDRLLDVAWKTVGRHFGRMLWNEAGTRLGIDAEYLHDMRVATRRLRTGLDVFADALPEETRESFTRDLRWVGRGLGRVRDTDVHLGRVAALRAEGSDLERAALSVFARSLEIRRAKQRVRLLQRLDCERYAEALARLRAWVDAGPPAAAPGSAAGLPAYSSAHRLIAGRHRALLEAYEAAQRTLAPADLHATRIAAKRLRYCVEYFAGLEGPGAARRAKRLARFQDFLGDRQDMATLLLRMRKYAETIPGDDRELALGAGSVLGHLERLARTKRGELRQAWEELGEA